MLQECPKCHYVRVPTDTAPDYECPRCGVVYAKVEAARGLRRDGDGSPMRTSRAVERGGGWRPGYGLVALLFIVVNLGASFFGIGAAAGDGSTRGFYAAAVFFGTAQVVSLGGFMVAVWQARPRPLTWLTMFIPVSYGIFILVLFLYTALGGN
jgi:hypothetical protein